MSYGFRKTVHSSDIQLAGFYVVLRHFPHFLRFVVRRLQWLCAYIKGRPRGILHRNYMSLSNQQPHRPDLRDLFVNSTIITTRNSFTYGGRVVWGNEWRPQGAKSSPKAAICPVLAREGASVSRRHSEAHRGGTVRAVQHLRLPILSWAMGRLVFPGRSWWHAWVDGLLMVE